MENLSRIFKLLDDYARERHRAFLAEMTPLDGETTYNLCFRPLSVNRGASSRFDCRYIQLPADALRGIGTSGALDAETSERLDAELSELG